jgi:hypothetical protein
MDGNGIAAALLGVADSGSLDDNAHLLYYNYYVAGYIQDNWKVSSKLSLNLGFRYDVQTPVHELNNQVNVGYDYDVVNPLSSQILSEWNKLAVQYNNTNPKYPYPVAPPAIYGGLQFAGKNGAPTSPMKWDWTDLQPRFGFAYAVTPKTVLRGGFGIYYKSIWDKVTSSTFTNTGFSQSTPYQPSLNGGITPAFANQGSAYSMANPFPNGYLTPSGAAQGALTGLGTTLGIFGPIYPMPRTYQYSFTIERQLPWMMLLDAAYVGTKTVHDQFAYNSGMSYGDIPYGAYTQGAADPNYLNRNVPNPMYGILPASTSLGSSPTVSAMQLMRSYPELTGLNSLSQPWATYRYDSLQVSLKKRVLDSKAGALTYQFAYTFSKSYEQDHAATAFLAWQPVGSPVGGPIHEIADIDRPQNLSFSGVYDIPVGHGRPFGNQSRLVDWVFGNWNFDWIFTFSSGDPLSYPGKNFACSQWTVPNQTKAQWFNNDQSCWVSNPSFTFSNLPDRFPNIRNPTEPQLTIGLQKRFSITERIQFQLRGEAFNVTNTPIYAPPNTSTSSGAQFGVVPNNQYNFPRQVQVSAKFLF